MWLACLMYAVRLAGLYDIHSLAACSGGWGEPIYHAFLGLQPPSKRGCAGGPHAQALPWPPLGCGCAGGLHARALPWEAGASRHQHTHPTQRHGTDGNPHAPPHTPTITHASPQTATQKDSLQNSACILLPPHFFYTNQPAGNTTPIFFTETIVFYQNRPFFYTHPNHRVFFYINQPALGYV